MARQVDACVAAAAELVLSGAAPAAAVVAAHLGDAAALPPSPLLPVPPSPTHPLGPPPPLPATLSAPLCGSFTTTITPCTTTSCTAFCGVARFTLATTEFSFQSPMQNWLRDGT